MYLAIYLGVYISGYIEQPCSAQAQRRPARDRLRLGAPKQARAPRPVMAGTVIAADLSALTAALADISCVTVPRAVSCSGHTVWNALTD